MLVELMELVMLQKTVLSPIPSCSLKMISKIIPEINKTTPNIIEIFKYFSSSLSLLNNCDNICPVLGDCLVETPNYKADRIFMGYVKTTHHYLKAAIDSLNKGGTIHYHETVPEKLIETRPISRIKQSAGDRDVELLKINKIKKYSPGVWHVVIDALID